MDASQFRRVAISATELLGLHIYGGYYYDRKKSTCVLILDSVGYHISPLAGRRLRINQYDEPIANRIDPIMVNVVGHPKALDRISNGDLNDEAFTLVDESTGDVVLRLGFEWRTLSNETIRLGGGPIAIEDGDDEIEVHEPDFENDRALIFSVVEPDTKHKTLKQLLDDANAG